MKLIRTVAFLKRAQYRSPGFIILALLLVVAVAFAASSLRLHFTPTSKVSPTYSGNTSGNTTNKSTALLSGNSTSGGNVTTDNNAKSSTKSDSNSQQGVGGTSSQPSSPAKLILSTYSVTLGNSLANPSSGSAQVTFSSNVGPISQPTQSVSKLAQAIVMGITPQSSTTFQDQWTFSVARESIPEGGSDTVTFTAKTKDGLTLTAQLSVNLIQIPSFTTIQGPLSQVINGDGTVTITAHITLVPSVNFGNPLIHVCDDTNFGGDPRADPCSKPDSYAFIYNGSNDITLTNTVPDTTHYVTVGVWADGVYGSYILPWSF